MPSKADQPVEVLRKTPKQARSGHTLQTIYEATIQIIQRDGAEKITTNRIAEVAGVSVGTLYQYFRNKETLLLSMATVERDQMIRALDAIFDAAPKHTLDQTLRSLVRISLRVFFERNKVRKMIINVAFRHGAAPQLASMMSVAVAHVGERLAELEPSGVRPMSPAARFVASRALFGVLRSAVMEDSRLIGTPDMEEELVRMMTRLLT